MVSERWYRQMGMTDKGEEHPCEGSRSEEMSALDIFHEGTMILMSIYFETGTYAYLDSALIDMLYGQYPMDNRLLWVAAYLHRSPQIGRLYSV